MKKFLKNAIAETANYWRITPYEVVDIGVKSTLVAIGLFTSIRPFCWVVVKIAELIGRI